MRALIYENFIRGVHGVGRYGIPAANADVYRRFEHAYQLFRSEKELRDNNLPRQWGKSVENLEREYKAEALQIATYLTIAINAIRQNYRYSLSTDQIGELGEVASKLYKPTFDSINQSVNELSELLYQLDQQKGDVKYC